MYLYSIYDSKSKTYHAPFTGNTDGEALRVFAEIVNDSRTLLYKYPSDYSLFCLGGFDPDTGSILGTEPKFLDMATVYKTVVEPETESLTEKTEAE